MNGFDKTAQDQVNRLIEDAEAEAQAEKEQARADEDRTELRQRTNRWAAILRLLAVSFLFVAGAVSVCVYLLDSYSKGNGDPLLAVGFGIIGALWLGLATTLRKDFVWLANAFRGFRD